MAYINNTLINRFVATHQATKPDQVHLLSNRHAQPLERTTSKPQSDGAHSDSTSLTYTNLSPDVRGGRAVISSQGASSLPTSPPEPQPTSQFDSMGAVKALVARYKGAMEAEALNLPKTGELFDLTVQTRDGDTVTLSISTDVFLNKKDSEVALASESNFSFVVAGELSDKEREAVDALVNRLGNVAGAYQKDGWADVAYSGRS